MSTLWTPGGERPIRRDPPGPADRAPGGGAPPGSGGPGRPNQPARPGGDDPSAEAELTDEEMRLQMEQLREELARTPAELVIANHAFGLFELAALHLSLQPPQLDQARLAIDALAAVVDGL